MKTRSNIILVPTDFTKVADCAIEHAIEIAKTQVGEISLLHVVAKQVQVESVKEKLETLAEDITNKSGVKTNIIIRIGNIFEDIGDVAAEIGAGLIIMGTHGVKGFQHITGSHALKVITNSSVPFIVVQEKSIKNGYNEIVLPLSLSRETKQKLSATVNLAKYFKSKVFIIAPKEDDEFLSNTVNRNLAFAKNYLAEQRVPFSVKQADEKGSFVKQVVKYAHSIDADLIAIVNSPDGSVLPDFLASADEQQIITNEFQIPVLCINPAQTTVSSGILGS
ncbi:MAG: universal stress protein [Bacteroidetes bacterium]|nr:universal stress protein [Bacteroidota bacterium]HET6245670.1 universal stress protein [Bacteroidia bacterium]